MRARQFEGYLHDLSGWPRSEIDQRTRGLREAGMLPQGGRGLNAPSIDPAHGSAIFIATAVAESAADAPVKVARYAGMVSVQDPTKGTFGEALDAILSRDKVKARDRKVRSITLCRSWPQAEIRYQGRGKTDRIVVYRPAESPIEGYGFGARIDVTFNGGVLHQLALLIAQSDDDERREIVDG